MSIDRRQNCNWKEHRGYFDVWAEADEANADEQQLRELCAMKIIRYLAAALLVQMLLPYASATELSAAEKREIVLECQQLVTDYAYYRDLRDADKLAELFTEDARMHVRGHWKVGHQELRDHVNSDDMNTVSMHLMTTIKIITRDEDSASGVSYVAVAHERKAEDEPAPVPLDNFVVVGKYHDTFVRTNNGWKISERVLKPIFRKPAADIPH